MVLRSIFAAGLAAALLVGAAPAAAATSGAGPTRAASGQSELQALVNQYRSANGLQTVSLNGPLSSSASWLAADMAANNYFSHTSSDGLSAVQRMAGAGYPAYSSYTGEDLAAGFAGAAQVFAGWIASPAHNAVLLNPNYDAVGIGIGYSVTSTYKWYWAADFAGPGVKAAPVAPPPAPPVAPPQPAPVAVAPPAPRVPAAPAAPPAAPARPVALAAVPVASAADPAPSPARESEAASPSAEPVVDLAAVARAAAAVRHEDLLVKQMTRLLLRLERRTDF